jgi:argininosuccinate lyase
MRHEIMSTVNRVKLLFDALITNSEQYKSFYMPGYSHLQVAMPSSFGLWFGAHAESLTDDLTLLQGAYHLVNRNPPGSAAGYRTFIPVNRRMTSQLLGFDDLNYNILVLYILRTSSLPARVSCPIRKPGSV